MRNILRRPRTRVVVATALAGGLVLGMAAAAHADFTSPSQPMSAPSVAPPPSANAAKVATTTEAATTAEAAATWKAHDKNCETVIAPGPVEAGSVCAETQKRVTASGSVTGYRGRVTIAPAPGQSITPDRYVWNSEITYYCSGGCTPKTTAWTSTWSPVLTSDSTYVAWSPRGDGTWAVGAGWSEWFKTASRCVKYSAGEVCVNRYDRGYRKFFEERGPLVVKPVSGQYIEPRWVRVGHVESGKSTSKTKDLCDPSCTKRRTNWSSSVVAPVSGFDEGFASASWTLPSGAIKSMRVAYP